MMHKVLHNFGDWELDTRHMTRLEKSIYFDSRTLYLKDGKPLTDDLPLLERLLMCHSDDEKQALAFVLSHKFSHDKKRRIYRHKEWDLILKNYKFRHKDTDDSGTKAEHSGTQGGTQGGTKAEHSGTQQRKEKHQNKVNYLRKLLADNGIKTPAKSSISELTALCNEHKIFIDWNMAELIAEHIGTDSGTKAEHSGTPKNHAITNNHKPITNNHKPITNNHNTNTPLTPQGEQAGNSEQVATDETHLQTNHTDTQTKQTTDQTSSSSRQSKSSAKSKSDKPKFDPKSYPLADTVDYELWCDFVDMRQAIKKPLTEQACKLLVKDFTAWIDKGLSPNLAISASIKNSWQGVFESHASPSNLPQPQSRPAWQTPSQPPVRDFAKAAAEIEQHGNPILLNLQRAFGAQPPQPINVTPQEISHE